MVAVGVSAATDVSGYGLIGHLSEMCEGANLGAEISAAAVPVLAGAREWLARGFSPAGSARNAATFRTRVRLSVPESEYTLMNDAQTSGGLLIAVSPERAQALEARFRESGLFYAKVGRMTADSGRITLKP
jgi:selenide,water dikinase